MDEDGPAVGEGGSAVGEPFRHRLRVRYGECDAQGVVFNAHYLSYFDISLTELWRAAFGGYGVMLERGVDLVVAEARLRYLGAARFDEVLELRIAVTRMGETSITSDHAILRDEELLVRGMTRHVVVDPGLRKQSIPRWLRDGLGPWTVPAGQLDPAG